ncbi:ABC-2 type transport system ATP-binding protein [Streptomyces sp. DfronAA-171]|nr:ABC-2 type transport system ATP-binding protein [Streptomyces sp. DfronAA-171]
MRPCSSTPPSTPTPPTGAPSRSGLGLADRLDARWAKLSGGQKQRLSIALALLGRPRVLLLDELTTGLDPRARHETWQLVEEIRDSGVTILLVTHFMEEAQRLCDRVAVIDAGRVRALDTPARLVRSTSVTTVAAFTPSDPPDRAAVEALPGAAAVRVRGGRWTVEGTDETVQALLSLLARAAITAHGLRVTDAGLDSAYLDLTGA